MTLTADPQIRLFAAIELSPAWQAALASLVSELKPRLSAGAVRWTRPDGVHLTLKFYGEVPPEMVTPVEESLRPAAAAGRAFELQLGRLGIFPSPRAPRVLWTGVTGGVETLMHLQTEIESRAEPLGFKPEARGFTPHLTLGRMAGRLRPAEVQAVEALQDRLIGQCEPLLVARISLMRSELRGPRGPLYTRLADLPLGGPTTTG